MVDLSFSCGFSNQHKKGRVSLPCNRQQIARLPRQSRHSNRTFSIRKHMEPENHHGLVMSTFDPVQIGEVRQQSLVDLVMFLCSLSIYISLLLNLFFLWDAIRRCLRWPCQGSLRRVRRSSRVGIRKPSRRHCNGVQETHFL